MAKGGFVLSPLIKAKQEFTELGFAETPQQFADKQVMSIRIESATGVGVLWQNLVHVNIKPISFDSGPINDGADNSSATAD